MRSTTPFDIDPVSGGKPIRLTTPPARPSRNSSAPKPGREAFGITPNGNPGLTTISFMAKPGANAGPGRPVTPRMELTHPTGQRLNYLA
jgi:hypothetical protein